MACRAGSGRGIEPHNKNVHVFLDKDLFRALQPERDALGKIKRCLVESPKRKNSPHEKKLVDQQLRANAQRHYVKIEKKSVSGDNLAEKAARLHVKGVLSKWFLKKVVVSNTDRCKLLNCRGFVVVGKTVVVATNRKQWAVIESTDSVLASAVWASPEGKIYERDFCLPKGWSMSGLHCFKGKLLSFATNKKKREGCGVHSTNLQGAYSSLVQPFTKLIYTQPVAGAQSAVALVDIHGNISCPVCKKKFYQDTVALARHYGIEGRWVHCEWKTFQTSLAGDT